MGDPAQLNTQDGNVTLRAPSHIAISRINADTDNDENILYVDNRRIAGFWPTEVETYEAEWARFKAAPGG